MLCYFHPQTPVNPVLPAQLQAHVVAQSLLPGACPLGVTVGPGSADARAARLWGACAPSPVPVSRDGSPEGALGGP